MRCWRLNGGDVNGPGGWVSPLALKAAAEMTPAFRDGVWFVSLGRSKTRLVSARSEALGGAGAAR